MTQPPADPLVGTTILHYEILAKIGGGGMGVVYSARDRRLGRLVALKFLPPQWSHDEAAKQRFIREAQAASATDHPNICTIHDIESTADGRLFIVMAHYDGKTLKQMLDAGPLDVTAAVEIAAQAAEGVAKAHAHGVIHRDIKPGNVMVCGDCVKILDFGLAKFATALQLTMEGSTLGTAAYMSPEQVRGEETDARSDVWSLGVVLYEMLAGHPPFRGGYAEAVAYAIRHEPPPPLRGVRPEVPEALEQIVFRALHKDAAVRYQDARELARALRTLQGRAIPDDLLSVPISASQRPPIRPGVRSGRPVAPRWRRYGAIAAGVLIAMGAGAYPWLTRTGARIPIAIVPVVNQTGYPELDPYRLALTSALVAELGDSPNVRVLPFGRLLQIVRRFALAGPDVSSRQAVQAISTHSGARFLVAPTLVYENGTWKARAEFQDAATGTNAAVFETEPFASSLPKDTAYALMVALAGGIQEHFRSHGPGVAYSLRPAAVRLRSLDAAREFAEGLDAYEELEYAAARADFARAVELDSRNALAVAWLGRVSQLMRQADAASEAAARAATLVTAETPETERQFIAAMAAEARGDFAAAETAYADVAALRADEPEWLLELAAFRDRRVSAPRAIETYQLALQQDARLARPELELCRLYNRVNESARAKDHAQRALTKFRALGARGGEAQALFCLTDTLRIGSVDDRRAARASADAALAMLQQLDYRYNLPRAYNYVALAAGTQGNRAEAVTYWEKALAAAIEAGNVVLQPRVLNNLGVTHEALGNRSRAVEYYQQSYTLNEALGDEVEAARNRANAGALLIAYGGDQADGLRDVDVALAVFRKVGDRNFEVFCLQLIAAADRFAGRHEEAERELNRALAIAREHDLDDKVVSLTVDLAQSRLELGDYAAARELLVQASTTGSGPKALEARIRLGQVAARLGDAAGAASELARAASDLQEGGDRMLLPLLELVTGEAAAEAGRAVEARAHFARAAALSTDTLPDAAAVEATVALAALDAGARPREAEASLRQALDLSAQMGRVALQARARVALAQVYVARRNASEALRVLNAFPADGERTIGREMEAQVHYWKSRGLRLAGQSDAADAEATKGRQLLEALRASLPARYRAGFSARAAISVPLS